MESELKIASIIVDDEERGRNTLSSLLSTYCPEINLVDITSNVPEAVLSIRKHKPELVFLDVEMPVYNGFELLNFFDSINFEIIFVTAYSEHAIKAFEVSAVDYLLKPVDIDQLKLAVNKFKERRKFSDLQERIEVLRDGLNNDIKRIALPVATGFMFVELAEIVIFEAEGAYTTIYLKSGKSVLVSKKLKFFEDLLKERDIIFRPHRSYMINLNYLKHYLRGEGTIIMEGERIVSISRDKKVSFEQKLRSLKISQ